MSTNEEAVEAPRVPLSAQDRLLQILLLSMTVPFRAGGGLVFPIGFPGAGYRLEEWQFERYRAALDGRLRNQWGPRGVRRATFALLVLALLISIAFNFFAKQGHLDASLRPWLQILLVLPAAPVLCHTFLFNYRSWKHFGLHFADAPRVSRAAYLGRRMLGYVVARSLRPAQEAIIVLILAGAGAWLLRVALRETFIVLYVIAAGLLLAALFKAWQLFVYLQFRQRHGRAPTRADLAPVDPGRRA